MGRRRGFLTVCRDFRFRSQWLVENGGDSRDGDGDTGKPLREGTRGPSGGTTKGETRKEEPQEKGMGRWTWAHERTRVGDSRRVRRRETRN